MASETIRRVYEIDAKLSTDALASLRSIQATMKDLEKNAGNAGKAAQKAGKDAEEGAHGFDKLNLSSVGARRELLVLVHELSQGNFKQFGGSLLVLGERIDATSLIMSAAGLATIAFVAVVAGLAAAIAKGAIEQDKFNKALLITGNYAGQTASSYDALAKSISAGTNATIGSTREVLAILVKSGEIGPRLLEPATKAILAFERVSGENAEEVSKDFLKMQDGVLKWADEHNKQYHFLTLAQHDYIRSLEEAGKSEEAQLFVLKQLTDHIGGEQVKNLGYLAAAWETVRKAVSGAIDAIKDFGKDQDIATQIAKVQASIQNAETNRPKPGSLSAYTESVSGGAAAQNKRADDFIAAQREQLRALNDTLLRQTGNAADKAFEAYVQEQGIKGDAFVRGIQKQIRDGNKLDQVLTEFRASVDKERAAGKSDKDIFGSSSQEQDEALIRKHFGTQASAALESAVTARLRALGEEDAALKEQIRQYDTLGKSVNTAARAKLDFDISQGKLKGAGPADLTKLRTAADSVDADQQELRQRKAIKTADDRVKALNTEANAKALNTRETKVAVELAKLEADGLVPGTAAYISHAEAIKKAVNAIQDNVLARKLLAAEAATQDEANKLDQENYLIGLNTLERQKSAAIIKIQVAARKELVENPNAEAAIMASAGKQTDILTAALERNYAAQRAFSAGAKQAFTDYSEGVTNAAKFSNDIITGSLTQLEDAFVKFYHTGKLNLGSLFDFMKTEFIKQAAAVTVNKIFGDKGIQGFISDGIQSLGNLLGFNLGSVAGTTAQSAKAAETAAISQATLGLTAMGTQSAAVTSGFAAIVAAANEAAYTLVRLAATGSSSGGFSLNGIFGGSSFKGGATGIGDGFTTNAVAGYAKGGIMSSLGNVPLNAYASGGVATGPQMALFGEGRKNEAYIPLPDNRTVPVTLSGGGDGGGTVVNVYNNGGGDDVRKEESTNNNGQKQIDIYITKKVRDIVSKDIASGGGIAKNFEGQYGLSRANGAPK